MARNLFDILQWVRTNGDPTAMLRVRLKLLPLSVREGIILDRVDPQTQCSEDYLRAVRSAASEIVGRACPH